MSATGKEVIDLRNEGAMAYDRMIHDHGYEAARKMLCSRVTARCSVTIKKGELEAHLENLESFFRQTYMVLILTALHDEFGFGEIRLKRMKRAFDDTAVIVSSVDLMGKRYITLRDCAEDMNRVANMGIDLQMVDDADKDIRSLVSRAVSLEKVMAFLDKKGFRDAYDAIFKETIGDDCVTNRERTKEQRAEAKRRRREDHMYRAPNMNMFDPEVSAGYLTIIATVMRESGFDFDQIDALCSKVNEYLNWILQTGQDALETLERENKDMTVGDKEDGNVTDNTDESYQAEVS